YCSETEYQKVEIVDTDAFGRCLILDGKIQSAQRDEYIYHETLIHPAMILHSEPKNIMIVGGGEGAVLREIMKHPSVKRVLMVDIDRQVVDLCAEYLPGWNDGAFKDPRVELLFMDARKYLEKTEEVFDVIISDITEPLDDGPSYLLFTKEFYQTVNQRLDDQGILALQSGSFNLNLINCHAAIYNTLNLIFPFVRSYSAFIPSFDTAWGFFLASKKNNPQDLSTEKIDECLKKRKIENLNYYDGETHQHMFSVPKDIRKAIEREKRIIEDNRPLTTF
ncbi:MAG: polyamine aminopropyltransferase, partial [Firmicutes bacterium HGW-Firmicutes-13]